MNGAHDMGGMEGFGPVRAEPESQEPVFHAEWEGRVFGMNLAAGFHRRWNIDMGRQIHPDETEVRVWDSTSEMRFLVLPQRPEGTEGWSEEQLAKIVTRNSMVGVEKVASPEPLATAR